MKPGWHSHLSFLVLFQASKHQKCVREVDCKQYLSTRSRHTSAATCTPRYWSEARGQQVLTIFSVSGALLRELWACRPTQDWARPTGVFQALGEWDATQLLPAMDWRDTANLGTRQITHMSTDGSRDSAMRKKHVWRNGKSFPTPIHQARSLKQRKRRDYLRITEFQIEQNVVICW